MLRRLLARFAPLAPLAPLVVTLPLASRALAATPDCKGLPTQAQLQSSLAQVVENGNGGFFKPNMMWAAIVNRAGQVCAVAKIGDAWPGSRVIAAQKAYTANAFSNDQLALSTANLYTATQPGGSLFGLQASNPVDGSAAYKGDAKAFGTAKDPLVGARVGGVNVFGGGLALYGADHKTVLGGLGVSGDSSCTDHIIAWRMRGALALDNIPKGVGPSGDNIIHDVDAQGKSASGFGHPTCSPEAAELAKGLQVGTTKKG
jgi:uncharacterized protein GlcG (DUF336 family)